MQHFVDQLADAIREAAARSAALHIRGGGTKDFYGNYQGKGAGQVEMGFLDVASYAGIVDYEPTELVVTARRDIGARADACFRTASLRFWCDPWWLYRGRPIWPASRLRRFRSGFCIGSSHARRQGR